MFWSNEIKLRLPKILEEELTNAEKKADNWKNWFKSNIFSNTLHTIICKGETKEDLGSVTWQLMQQCHFRPLVYKERSQALKEFSLPKHENAWKVEELIKELRERNISKLKVQKLHTGSCCIWQPNTGKVAINSYPSSACSGAEHAVPVGIHIETCLYNTNIRVRTARHTG